MQKDGYFELIREIKNFIGEDWFNAECDRAGKHPDSGNTHPLIYSWINTDTYLNEPKSMGGLEIIPRSDMLNILMIGTYFRLIDKSKVCDLNGNILSSTVKDFFQNRLRNAQLFDSAVYEFKIASLYLREGYTVNFIDDKKTHPEFLVMMNNKVVYVECKRIEKRQLKSSDADTIHKLYNKIKDSLFSKKKNVIVVCPNGISNQKGWMEKKIQELICSDGKITTDKTGGYFLKIIPPLPAVSLPGYDIGKNFINYYENYCVPFLDQQMEEYSVSNKDIVIEHAPGKLTPTLPPFHTYEILNYFGVAFQSLPIIIFGIKKMINKAYSQLPAGCNGLVYVECPPYTASDEVINEFRRIIQKELKAISRINALVITAVRNRDDNSMEHISNIFLNTNSTCIQLPNNFSIVPLLDNFELE